MKTTGLSTVQFGMAVSAYAFSAGISGLFTAGFADKFDRKKLLLFFYIGFIAGTVFCGLANSYFTIIAARVITGLFGGVIGSISMAILTDIFDIHHRGRAMGFIQMGFSASQVLGIPIGLYISYHSNWHMPFIMVACLGLAVTVLIVAKLRPVTAHLAQQRTHSPFMHLVNTFARRDYRIGFLATAFLSIGGFMMMPFGSAFAINNLKIDPLQLTPLFMVSGFTTLFIMPLVGKLSDKIDKFIIFAIATVWMMVVVVFYTHLSVTPLWEVMIFNVLMMIGIMSRMVPAQAIASSVPEMRDRGAYMSINASLSQFAGGIAANVAGHIVYQKDKNSPLEHYDILGYVMVGISVLALLLLYRVNVMVKKRLAESKL